MTSTHRPDPIEVREVSKAHGQTPSLRDVSLTFEPGGIHALLGPNGAGKTTLFRLLLGLTTPDTGTVSMPDVGVGCAFQDPQCYADLTVAENLELFGRLGAGSGGLDEHRLDQLLDGCGLERVRHRPAGELSAGFATRLDVALALVDRPQVLLLDEPLADVDDQYRRRLVALFEDYRRPDRQLIVATHQFEWFESQFETVTVLDAGRVRTHEAAANLLDGGNGGLRSYYAGVTDSSRGRSTGQGDV